MTRYMTSSRIHLLVCYSLRFLPRPLFFLVGDTQTRVMSGGERGQRGKETSSSKVGGAAASGAGSTMLHFVDVVKQYPGQEQVDLRVEIEVPGTWFGGTSQGCLTNAEKREKYKAQAVEFSELREFVGPSSRRSGHRLSASSARRTHKTTRQMMVTGCSWRSGIATVMIRSRIGLPTSYHTFANGWLW